jgi:hypothetical protein
MIRLLAVLIMTLWPLAGDAYAAESFTGTYTANGQNGPITLSLAHKANGRVTGTLSGGAGTLTVHATVQEGDLVGTASNGTTKVYLEAELEGTQLHVILAEMSANGQPDYTRATEVSFTRGGIAPAAPESKPSAKRHTDRPGAAGPSAGSGSTQDKQLTQLLLGSAWCSFTYNKITGYSSRSRNVFTPDGILHMNTDSEGGSSGPNGSIYSQNAGGGSMRWKVEQAQLWLDQGGGFQGVTIKITRESSGFMFIKSNGSEYSQCR